MDSWNTIFKITDNLFVSNFPSSLYRTERITKMTRLRDEKITAVINLTELDERNRDGKLFYNYVNDFRWAGIECFRFPITDLSIPSVNFMKRILDKIDELHQQGKVVCVHCVGGRGRSNTVSGCYMIRKGIAFPHNVFDIIDELKKNTTLRFDKCPETTEQRNFVKNWKKGQ